MERVLDGLFMRACEAPALIIEKYPRDSVAAKPMANSAGYNASAKLPEDVETLAHAKYGSRPTNRISQHRA